MTRNKAILGAGVVLLSVVVAATIFSSWPDKNSSEPLKKLTELTPTPTPTINYKKIAGTWTYDCESPVQKPETIMLTCADGGIYVTNIKWESWKKVEAVGKGTYSQNLCDPTCAEGKRVMVPIKLRLSEVFEYKGRNILKSLDITTVTGKNLPNGSTKVSWDVSEFALLMDWTE